MEFGGKTLAEGFVVKNFHVSIFSISTMSEGKGQKMSQVKAVKVSKFQKPIFLFPFPFRNKRNYFLISAQASKVGLIKKWRSFYINWWVFFKIETSWGQKSKNNFVRFWKKREQENLLLKFTDLYCSVALVDLQSYNIALSW